MFSNIQWLAVPRIALTCTASISHILLSARASPFLCQDGRTALMFALAEGHTATVQLLVEAGADTDAKDKVEKGF